MPIKPCAYKVTEEADQRVLKISCEGCIYSPSIEDNPICMARTINKLLEAGHITKISFLQKQEYVYDPPQTELMVQLARLIDKLVNEEKIIAYEKVGAGAGCTRCYATRLEFLRDVVLRQLKEDPVGAHLHLRAEIIKEEVRAKHPLFKQCPACEAVYIQTLKHIDDLVSGLKIIKAAAPYLKEFKPGTRDIYREIFKPTIRPDFMYTKLVTAYPTGAEEITSYRIADDTDVMILKIQDDVRPLYHITPPEFKIGEEQYELLGRAREIIAEHKPQKSEFVDPERTREIFFNVERDLLKDLAASAGLKLSYAQLQQLAKILVRYTIGFGLIEVLLSDPKIQDISLNAPAGTNPVSIIHADYGECLTNITPTPREVDSWATKLRMLSARPLDEANPVLDTDLTVPLGRARVCAIQRPLSPGGLAYAFRRHRDKPWTLPLFINNRMITPLAAGLFSFLMDGARTMFIAGTRSAGKTSFLAALLVEIMRASRIITVEDSVTGDSRIIVKQGRKIRKTTVGRLIDDLIDKYGCENKFGRELVRGNLDNIKILSINSEGKQIIAPASLFIRHKVSKDIYDVKTSTGRKISVTGDHSLFTIGKKRVLSEARVTELRRGDYIAVPRVLNIKTEGVKSINLLDYLSKLGGLFVCGTSVRDFVSKNWEIIKKLSKQAGYSRSSISAWKRSATIPVEILKWALERGCLLDNLEDLKLKPRAGGRSLPIFISLNRDFLTFIGLWIADGCYDQKSVIISSSEPEERAVIFKVAKQLGLVVKYHSDGWAVTLNSAVLKHIMKEVLNLKGSAHTKQIPEWVYNLSKKQVSYLLKGFFSGDGCATDKEVVLALSSKQLLHDIQTLLLYFGIILRISNKQRSDKTYSSAISALKSLKPFMQHIGFLQKRKQKRLAQYCSKISTHDSSDIIPLSIEIKRELGEVCQVFNKQDYLTRKNNIGREHLKELLLNVPRAPELMNPLKFLANSDILWDKIISVRKRKWSSYVYDVSVPGCENFICENILAHNTCELPVDQLRRLGYDIQSMKVRSVIVGAEEELSAADGIRTSLRLGDSSLIIGEVRSKEALALFEAMRVGALANVVAGTIHGDSPYGVFDRVVNDLGVPRTSFKATDIIAVANPVKSPSGLERWRRLVQIAEVRKFWEEDPLREHGFANLLTYDPMTDQLEPTDVLLEGESEILKSIGARVREWVGDWDAIYNNILLRANIKSALVDAAHKTKDFELLEAPFVIKSNDQFHNLSSIIKEEVGTTDPKRVYSEFQAWLKSEIKKKHA